MLTPQEGGRSLPLNPLHAFRNSALKTDTCPQTQAKRVLELQTAFRKAHSKYERDDSPTAGQIRNLGLLGKEEDTNAVLGKK